MLFTVGSWNPGVVSSWGSKKMEGAAEAIGNLLSGPRADPADPGRMPKCDALVHCDVGLHKSGLEKQASERWEAAVGAQLPAKFYLNTAASYGGEFDTALIAGRELRIEPVFPTLVGERFPNDEAKNKVRWRQFCIVDILVDVEEAGKRKLIEMEPGCPSQMASRCPLRIVVGHTVSGGYKKGNENHQLKGQSGDRIKSDCIMQAVRRLEPWLVISRGCDNCGDASHSWAPVVRHFGCKVPSSRQAWEVRHRFAGGPDRSRSCLGERRRLQRRWPPSVAGDHEAPDPHRRQGTAAIFGGAAPPCEVSPIGIAGRC